MPVVLHNHENQNYLFYSLGKIFIAPSIGSEMLHTYESDFSILVVLLSFSKYYSTEVSLLLKSLELIIVSGMCLFIIIIIIFPCAYIV